VSPLTGISIATKIELWIYGMADYADEDYVSGDIFINGGLLGETVFPSVDNGYHWKTISYNGSWTQAQINAMQPHLINYDMDLGGTTMAGYVKVTYTAGGGEEPPATKAYFIKKKKNIIFIH
jgi:hypothetical protein